METKGNETCCVNSHKVASLKKTLLSDELVYDMADFFKVFGDSTRLKILYTLTAGELCVGDISEILEMNQSAVSHQLRILRQNDIVRFRKAGKTVYYALDDAHVASLLSQGLEHMMHR